MSIVSLHAASRDICASPSRKCVTPVHSYRIQTRLCRARRPELGILITMPTGMCADRPAIADRNIYSLDLEEMIGRPREHLEFTIWYLNQKKFVQRDDNSRLIITADGVEYLEANSAESSGTISIAIRMITTHSSASMRTVAARSDSFW